MAKKKENSKKSKSKTKEKLITIEELAKKHDIPGYVMAGVKQRNNWGQGKKVSESDFKEKVKSFLKGRMSNR
ncbi:hypothetical protein JCM16358_23150 [Halanaerocella petrolearia]